MFFFQSITGRNGIKYSFVLMTLLQQKIVLHYDQNPFLLHYYQTLYLYSRSDESEIERVGLPGTSILKRNCDRYY